MITRHHIPSVWIIQCIRKIISKSKLPPRILLIAYFWTNIQLYLIRVVIAALGGWCPCWHLVFVKPCLNRLNMWRSVRECKRCIIIFCRPWILIIVPPCPTLYLLLYWWETDPAWGIKIQHLFEALKHLAGVCGWQLRYVYVQLALVHLLLFPIINLVYIG